MSHGEGEQCGVEQGDREEQANNMARLGGNGEHDMRGQPKGGLQEVQQNFSPDQPGGEEEGGQKGLERVAQHEDGAQQQKVGSILVALLLVLVGKSSVTDYLSHYNMCYDAAIIIWFLVANGREEVSILVMGGPGTGKSTLINGLFGKEKAIACNCCVHE